MLFFKIFTNIDKIVEDWPEVFGEIFLHNDI